MVSYEGFLTYGGMTGRDMEAMAQGFIEGLDERYLKHRIDQVRYLGDILIEAGIPIQRPVGGHAVFVDCGAIAPHIPYDEFPALSVTNALYIEGGVRGVEVGSLLLGRDPDTNMNLQSPVEFLRLTIPRRVYTYEHLNVVGEALIKVYKNRKELKGYKFLYESPILRHFTSTYKPID